MKKFTVTLDIILTGDIEIEAKNITEARKLVKDMRFTLEDLKREYFYNTGLNKVVEISEGK